MANARAWGVALLISLACLGCGRKLPPLPPAPTDPVEITALKFEKGSVLATVACHTPAAKLVLLGKPQGMCPQCTDDMSVREEKRDVAGEVTLIDTHPEERCMVYRIRLEKDATTFLSPAQIVCR